MRAFYARGALCLAGALILLCSGCTRQDTPLTAPASPAGNHLLPVLPALDSRAVSTSATVDGAGYDDCSAGCTIDGTALVMAGPAQSFTWALFGCNIPPDYLPSGLEVEVDSVSGQFWVAVSDYNSGTWQWHGPYAHTAGVSPWERGVDMLSAGRDFYWAVAVEGGMSLRLIESRLSQEQFVYINTPGVGEIALRLTMPPAPRYPEGAPVIVQTNAWVMDQERMGFDVPLLVQSIGAIQLSYLWPGTDDGRSGVASEGVFDFGGENCQAALRDVLKFAGGTLADTQGRLIGDIAPVAPLTTDVGLVTFSHPGIMATNVLALHGAELPPGIWLIGGENPVSDQTFTKEIGYWKEPHVATVNPTYHYPADFTHEGLALDYSAAGWVENAQYVPGRPVFLDAVLPDYIMDDVTPEMWGERYFSSAMCKALLDNGIFTAATWPAGVATLEEARAAWPLRTVLGCDPISAMCWNHYMDLKLNYPTGHVMLVFAVEEHMQPQPDKPGIHMAYYGFHDTAQLWTRLNPDAAYIHDVFPGYGGATPDNPANAEPGNWLSAEQWGHPNGLDAKTQVSLAAVAEMADRTRAGDWSDNLAGVLWSY